MFMYIGNNMYRIDDSNLMKEKLFFLQNKTWNIKKENLYVCEREHVYAYTTVSSCSHVHRYVICNRSHYTGLLYGNSWA